MDSRNNIELAELILELIRGTLSPQQSEYLFKHLKEDAEARRYYIEFMEIHVGLQGHVDYKESGASDLAEVCELDSALLALAENEKTAMAVDIPEPEKDTVLLQNIRPVRQQFLQKRRFSKWDVYTLALSAAAVVLLAALVLVKPVGGRPVAVLTDTCNAQWDTPSSQLFIGKKLCRRPLTLKSGFAEITFDKGAKVILQAPIDFELDSNNSMSLYSGRLSASVPESATGFKVQTADAEIVDFGTEFGVVTSQKGETETHVFEGAVEMQLSNADKSISAKRLRKGQTGILSDGQFEISRLAGSDKSFVRDMDEIRFEDVYLERNLVVNGDFETNRDVPKVGNKDFDHLGHNVKIVGWHDETLSTLIPYQDFGGRHFSYQQPVSIPPEQGEFFFAGVEEGIVWQEINVAGLAGRIRSDDIRFDLSAWFGGWSDHLDNAVITLHFLDWTGFEVGTAKIGPLTVEERNSQFLFVERTASGRVPAETQMIRLEIETFEGTGASDAYVDNISLILNTN